MTDFRLVGLIPDFSISSNDLETDDGLDNAVAISLLLDARAGEADTLPEGETDRRGYWAEEFTGPVGSKLWLLERRPLNQTTNIIARSFALEALAWMVTAQVAKSVDVQVSIEGGVRFLNITIERPSGREVKYKHGLNWAEKARLNGVP